MFPDGSLRVDHIASNAEEEARAGCGQVVVALVPGVAFTLEGEGQEAVVVVNREVGHILCFVHLWF